VYKIKDGSHLIWKHNMLNEELKSAIDKLDVRRQLTWPV
jgi:hypothetical protein